MDMFSFLQDRYYKEVERKNALESRAQHHLSIWILLLTGYIYCLNKSLDLEVVHTLQMFINGFLSGTTLFIIWSGIKIYSCFKGASFGYLGDSVAYHTYYKDLKNFYFDKEVDSSDQVMTDYISNQLAELTDNNTLYNNNKTKKLVDSMGLLITVTIFLAVSFVGVFIGLAIQESEEIKIEVIEKSITDTKINNEKKDIFIENENFKFNILNLDKGDEKD